MRLWKFIAFRFAKNFEILSAPPNAINLHNLHNLHNLITL